MVSEHGMLDVERKRLLRAVANCNINAKNVLNFLLKMQKKWRITPEK